MADIISATEDSNLVADAFTATEGLNPANDFLDLDDLSNDALLRLLTNAYIEAKIDDDSVYVTERRGAWVLPDIDNKWICFAKYYAFQTSALEPDKLAYVNKINDVLPFIRASVSAKSGNLVFDWYLPIDGGITRRWLVYAVKRFLGLLDNAVDLDTANVF